MRPLERRLPGVRQASIAISRCRAGAREFADIAGPSADPDESAYGPLKDSRRSRSAAYVISRCGPGDTIRQALWLPTSRE